MDSFIQLLIPVVAGKFLDWLLGIQRLEGGVSCYRRIEVVERFPCLGYRENPASHLYERPCRTLKEKEPEALDPRPAHGQFSASGCRGQENG